MSSTLEHLNQFLIGEGIEHFTGLETLKLRRMGITAPVPPVGWWPRIIPALRIAERIREELGHSLIIGNGYRPKDLNKRVGGAKNSQHLWYRALDLDLPNSHRSKAEKYALYEAAAVAYNILGHEYKMGFGIYSAKRGTRVHIDCGWKRRCWGGDGKKWVRDLLASVR